MKKIYALLACTLIVLNLHGQTDKLIGKWNVSEVTADGQTMGVDKLKQYGMDTNYIEILTSGDLVMSDKNNIMNGSWKYTVDGNLLAVTIVPSEEAKARGEGQASMKYTVEAVDDNFLVLKLGNFMTTKYKKE